MHISLLLILHWQKLSHVATVAAREARSLNHKPSFSSAITLAIMSHYFKESSPYPTLYKSPSNAFPSCCQAPMPSETNHSPLILQYNILGYNVQWSWLTQKRITMQREPCLMSTPTNCPSSEYFSLLIYFKNTLGLSW